MSNKIEKQKNALIGLSIAGVVLGLLALVGGIVLIVSGIGDIGDKIVAAILKLVFGVLLILGGGYLSIFGFYTLFVGSAVKATKGSIAEGNIAMAGTVNMLKCKNCGYEVQPGDKVCGHCGHSLSDKKVCPKCGATNMSENKKCSACGADLEEN